MGTTVLHALMTPGEGPCIHSSASATRACMYTHTHTTLLQLNQCVCTGELNHSGNSSKLAWQVHTEPLPLKVTALTIVYPTCWAVH